jgi:Bacterial alpha-L-rhamnosidase 6 hairpin glycosidase domain/Bacterial alpha-L-rhamnosidase C-terminal domain/Bacterial alpha-L-rhamnosidase concanavalin-like domain
VLPVWAHSPAGGTDSGWAFLRGNVMIDRKPIRAATVYATGGSTEPARQYVFRLSLNGSVLGVGPARAPDPATNSEYSAWDVTTALRGGTDTFGALAYSPAHPDFQLELVVQYKDGQRQVWGTGAGWDGMDGGAVYPNAGSISPQYYKAPVENLNAERYPFGFDTPGYQAPPGTSWSTVVKRPPFTGLTPDPTANVTLAEHKPVKITTLGPGRYLLDFGVTQVGGLRLSLTGTAGEKVRLLSGEVLSGPNTVQYHLSAGDTYDDTWTLRAGKQTLQYWGYRVFRYVEVDGAPQPLTAANAAALALVYPSQPSRSSLTTSNDALDQVWQFSKNTIEALNLDLYLDSPTRERSGAYEGDDFVHQRAQAMTDGDSALAQFSLQYALTAMGLPKETPIFEFQQLAPVAALNQWWQTGDPDLLKSLYPQLKTILPTRYLGTDGLVSMPVNPFGGAHPLPGVPQALVDWPASERDGFVFSQQNTVENAFAYAAYSAMAQIAVQVGDKAGASADAAAAAKIQSAMRSRLYDPATGAFRDGVGVSHEAVQSSVYAVALGVASPAQAKTAAAYVARQGMACSVYCAGYLLQALYDGGQAPAALRLLTADSATSWRHMIALGAGSTMEAWVPAEKANLTYSHPWAASPAYIVPQYLFGVSALTPGWGTVLIRPQPGGLASGSVKVPTPRGAVSVAFTSGSGGFTATVGVPVSATAQVALPGVHAGQRVYVDGSARTAASAPADGPAGAADAGIAVVSVGSGSHTVSTSP